MMLKSNFQYLQNPLFAYCVPDQELRLSFGTPILLEDRFPVFEENFAFYTLSRTVEMDGDKSMAHR